MGWGYGAESNGATQTALLVAAPCVAAVQLCTPLAPADFSSGEAMAVAAREALTAAYSALEARYKDWPTVHGDAPLPPRRAGGVCAAQPPRE